MFSNSFSIRQSGMGGRLDTLYTSSYQGHEYYDKSSIKKVNKNIIHVWTKILYNEAAKTKTYSFLKNIGKAPENFDKLSHVKILSEVDCVNDKIISISMIFYDTIGNLIYSSPKSFDEWADIVPDSNTEKLKNIVCSDGKTSNKEEIVC